MGKTQNRAEKRHFKVLKLHILKPAGNMTWPQLSALLEGARYRVFRLANLVLSEAYLSFHQSRGSTKVKGDTIGKLNRELRQMLEGEKTQRGEQDHARYSKEGALPTTVVDALSLNKLRGLTSRQKWSEVVRGKTALPTFRLEMAIPVRCDKPGQKRLERRKNGEIEVDLMITTSPYPRVVIATKRESLSDGQRVILDRLLEEEDGYRQRCFEIKKDPRSKGKWHLFVTYELPASPAPMLSTDRIVGVDLGFSCPLYAAINNGHARLGRRHFSALGARIRSLQNQVIRRRREIQRGGSASLTKETARAGHGRKRKLLPTEKLEGRITQAYTTLNHQLSAAVIKFALDNGAGVIQIEDLKGLSEELTGTYIGERWRYFELQNFLAYKAAESGIELQKVNPRFTSRRCSECGQINVAFSRSFRDNNRASGKSTRFECLECGYKADADYNAARNLATAGIETKIREQAAKQGLSSNDL